MQDGVPASRQKAFALCDRVQGNAVLFFAVDKGGLHDPPPGLLAKLEPEHFRSIFLRKFFERMLTRLSLRAV